MRHARINGLTELPDGSGRFSVPDLNGKLYLLPKQGGTPVTYLDIAARYASEDFFSGRGLGSGFGFAAFHPDFKKNGKFYTTHTERGASLANKTPDLKAQPEFLDSVVTEWTATNPAANTFSGSSREILRIRFAGQTHAIQQIDFNDNAKPVPPTTACSTSPSARAASAGTRLAAGHGRPARQDPADRPGRPQQCERQVRHPEEQPVRRHSRGTR